MELKCTQMKLFTFAGQNAALRSESSWLLKQDGSLSNDALESLPIFDTFFALVERISDLGIVIDSSFNSSAHKSKAHQRLAMLTRTFVCLIPELFISAYSSIFRSNL